MTADKNKNAKATRGNVGQSGIKRGIVSRLDTGKGGADRGAGNQWGVSRKVDNQGDVAQSSAMDAASGAKNLSRRNFVAGLGGFGAGAILAGGAVGMLLSNDAYAIPVSGGYLLVDSKKCGTCQTCMLACTLAHTGKSNLNLSRIQVAYNPLGQFPHDCVQHQCHQCPYPPCIEACPTHANHADKLTGVRMIDKEKCIGCERCINACPYTPSRVQWNYEEKCSQKCDLCLDTPYFDRDGGPGGHQACVDACPMRAICFTTKLPDQKESGYDINMRTNHWAKLGFPADDAGRVLPSVSVPGSAPAFVEA